MSSSIQAVAQPAQARHNRHLDYFVDPVNNEDRYELKDGFAYVVLKRSMNTGEALAMQTAGSDAIELPRDTKIEDLDKQANIAVRVDFGLMRLMKVRHYLLEWNIPGPDGRTAPITVETLKRLKRETFEEIHALVEQQEQAVAKLQQQAIENPESDLGKGGPPAPARSDPA